MNKYEYKTFSNTGDGSRWMCITDEHMQLIEEEGWEIVFFDVSNKGESYSLQLKREL